MTFPLHEGFWTHAVTSPAPLIAGSTAAAFLTAPRASTRAMLWALAVVLVGHWAALAAWSGRSVPSRLPPAPAGRAAFEVRQIAVLPVPSAAQPDAAPLAVPRAANEDPQGAEGAAQRAAAPANTLAPGTPSAQQAAPTAQIAARPAAQVATATAAVMAARPAPASKPDLAPTPPEADDAGQAAATVASPAPAWPALPTYRTAPPPSLALHYAVSRGAASGTAVLEWRRTEDGRYALELRSTGTAAVSAAGALAPSSVAAATAALTPHWTSQGAMDAAGVAPERFAVARRGRERHAANFQREAGIITFAGPARIWPLLAGAQDRLSWMLQLAAVLEAEPQLRNEGAQISMMVVGSHGDADVWTFTVLGATTLEGPGGEPLPALHLHREGRHAHDAQVQVWLAPTLHHLPVRLQLARANGSESTEWRLRALQAP